MPSGVYGGATSHAYSPPGHPVAARSAGHDSGFIASPDETDVSPGDLQSTARWETLERPGPIVMSAAHCATGYSHPNLAIFSACGGSAC
jgi:hypothetical protein